MKRFARFVYDELLKSCIDFDTASKQDLKKYYMYIKLLYGHYKQYSTLFEGKYDPTKCKEIMADLHEYYLAHIDEVNEFYLAHK